jgi:type VI secretion system secreted protein Hcp
MNAPKTRLAAALLALAFPLTSSAALNAYLKLDGIEGESTAQGHEKEIVIESWSMGARAHGSGGGGGAGKTCLSDLSLLKMVDKASPLLLQATAVGAHIPNATIAVRKAGEKQQDYFIIRLKDVIVTSVNQSSGGDVAMESLSLGFASMTMTYRVQAADGSLGTKVETTVSGARC